MKEKNKKTWSIIFAVIALSVVMLAWIVISANVMRSDNARIAWLEKAIRVEEYHLYTVTWTEYFPCSAKYMGLSETINRTELRYSTEAAEFLRNELGKKKGVTNINVVRDVRYQAVLSQNLEQGESK